MPNIWEHVDRCGPDECWPWTGPRFRDDGYGYFRIAYPLAKSTRMGVGYIHPARPPDDLRAARRTSPDRPRPTPSLREQGVLQPRAPRTIDPGGAPAPTCRIGQWIGQCNTRKRWQIIQGRDGQKLGLSRRKATMTGSPPEHAALLFCNEDVRGSSPRAGFSERPRCGGVFLCPHQPRRTSISSAGQSIGQWGGSGCV